METQGTTVSPRSIALPLGLAYGLFSGAKFILFETVDPEIATQEGSGGAVTAVPWIVAVALLAFAHQQFKKKGDGFMSFGQGYLISVLMGVFGGLAAAACMFVYLQFINPEYAVLMREFAVKEMSKGEVPEQQMEMMEKMAGIMTSPVAIAVMKWFMVLFLYLIIGLIVSIFTKKENSAAPF